MKKKMSCILGMFLTVIFALSGCGKDDSKKAPDFRGESSSNPIFQMIDFIVEVEEDRDPIVLQLTDTQIIDAGQSRPNRTIDETYLIDKIDELCYNYVTETIEATNPDLILLTGDNIYGEFDDNGSVWLSFVAFMDSFKIPWALIFGNHDSESKMGVDWQCEQLEKADYCLFKQRTLTGNGNFTVGVAQGNELKRVFYMLDSNGCSGASSETRANGHTQITQGFALDQFQWFQKDIDEVRKASPNTKISFVYHIPQAIFSEVFEKYTSSYGKRVYIDYLIEKEEGDFGYIGEGGGSWDYSGMIWADMKVMGCDSVFVGHNHCNSASIVYEGIRFQFGQKSSAYDYHNYIDENGIVKNGYPNNGTALVGGSVIPLSKEDGSIKNPYIYLCGNAEEKINKSAYTGNE